ncbi:MAG: glycosyltransferase [Planctomycetota bacterium]
MPNSLSVAAIVLAFSRDEMAKQLLAALRGQTTPPDEIIVVYQGSSPEMAAWLREQGDIVLVVQENLGSAGGFSRGIEESIRRGHGWTWVFDDDAIPNRDALEVLRTRPYFGKEGTSFLGSRIVNPSGGTYMSPRGNPESQDWYATVGQDHCLPATDACWLGLLVSSLAVQAVGLPIAEFFLWDEDREFVSRLARFGPGYCAVDSVIVHYQRATFDPFGSDFIKLAYYARNNIARAKIEPVSFATRCYRMVKRSCHFLGMVVKGKAPLRLVPWIAKGWFLFWPRVRYPAPPPDRASQGLAP